MPQQRAVWTEGDVVSTRQKQDVEMKYVCSLVSASPVIFHPTAGEKNHFPLPLTAEAH